MPRHRPQDHFGRKAKDEGFAARSVYKLREIDERVQLLRRGQRVLDLGAAPGSWTQYAAERVGDEGRVVAVDLAEMRAAVPKNVVVLQHDVYALTPEVLKAAGDSVPTEFDLVLSDMAPKTTGARVRDQFLSYELYLRAVQLTDTWLVRGGSFAGKIFQSAELEDARKATAERFEHVKIVKPKASRSESYEIFLVGLRRK
jgi:23S rRNA (uridine2552-2'-O)-methyltransferase